jgi:hypothetical protein
MKLEEGKRYVVKDGRVTSPMEKSQHPERPFKATVGNARSWNPRCYWTSDGFRFQREKPTYLDVDHEYIKVNK